jgi:hypothetical protein
LVCSHASKHGILSGAARLAAHCLGNGFMTSQHAK